MIMVAVRKAKIQDLPKILTLEQELFSPPYSIEDLKREFMKNRHSKIYILENAHQIIGFSILWILFEHAQIVQIGITKKNQNEGYGKKLMERMLIDAIKNGCEVMSLEVRESNAKAYGFYKYFDFKEATKRKAYYKNPTEDAYLLWRSLI